MGRIKIDVMRAQQCLEFLFKRRLARMFFLRSAGGSPASVLAMKIRERCCHARAERSICFPLPSCLLRPTVPHTSLFRSAGGSPAWVLAMKIREPCCHA
jgi:hypothetical protein